MNDFRFSVAMCVYKKDNPKWFDEALASLFSSTLPPNEIVLVEDGPVPDEIETVINKYTGKEPELNVVRLAENVGFGNACQVCVENAKYDWIARMDSDDICFSDRFEKQINYLKAHPEIDIVGGATDHFQHSLSEKTYKSEKPITEKEIYKALKSKCPFSHVTVMFKKAKVLEAGGYIEWFCEEDYYLWARMIKHGCRAANLTDSLVYVRSLPEQMARRGGWKYYKSEIRMQRFLLKEKFISPIRFLYNASIRFGAEILLTKRMRYQVRRFLIWRRSNAK